MDLVETSSKLALKFLQSRDRRGGSVAEARTPTATLRASRRGAARCAHMQRAHAHAVSARRAAQVRDCIKSSRVLNCDLSIEEVLQLVETLVYDSKAAPAPAPAPAPGRPETRYPSGAPQGIRFPRGPPPLTPPPSSPSLPY
jgi:hypothetical protein